MSDAFLLGDFRSGQRDGFVEAYGRVEHASVELSAERHGCIRLQIKLHRDGGADTRRPQDQPLRDALEGAAVIWVPWRPRGGACAGGEYDETRAGVLDCYREGIRVDLKRVAIVWPNETEMRTGIGIVADDRVTAVAGKVHDVRIELCQCIPKIVVNTCAVYPDLDIADGRESGLDIRYFSSRLRIGSVLRIGSK